MHGVQQQRDQVSRRPSRAAHDEYCMTQSIQMHLLRSTMIVGLLVGCDASSDSQPDAAVDDVVARNKDLLHRYHVDVWDEGHLDHAGQYLGADFTSHASVTTLPPGQQVGPDFLAQFRIGFPDMRSHADALVGDGDLAMLRWTITGTPNATSCSPTRSAPSSTTA